VFNVDNRVEEKEKLGEIGKDMLRTLRRFEEKTKWKNIKIRKTTYEQISKLAAVLGLEKYRVIDVSILILQLLLTDKIVLLQKVVGELGLAECVDRYWLDKNGTGYADLNPVCVLKKLVLPFYKKKALIENLINNLESLDKF